MPARSRGPTSHDVARRAGVSRSIVSGVLNGTMSTMRVSEETKQRVLDAAKELGYTPHPAARALRRQRTDVIGFIPRSLRRTPYDHPVPFLLGISIARAAMPHGYHVVEASAETSSARESDELARFLLDRRVDGVILDSPETAVEVQRFVDHGLPVVQIIRPQATVETPTITVDPMPGMTAALEHLIDLGHRQIGFIGHGGEHPADRSRLDCFTATLNRHDVTVRDEWVQLVADYDVEKGYAAGQRLLTSPSLPTAIFAAGDNLALGVLQVLYEAGIRVPDTLSLVSYDDIFAAHLAPPLTSVAQPLPEVAERAIAIITGMLDRPAATPSPPPAVVLPTSLTIRRSTVSPREELNRVSESPSPDSRLTVSRRAARG